MTDPMISAFCCRMSARISSMYARIFFSLVSVSDEAVVFDSAFCFLSCAQPEDAMNIGRVIRLVSKIRFSDFILVHLACLDFPSGISSLPQQRALERKRCAFMPAPPSGYKWKLPHDMSATNCQK